MPEIYFYPMVYLATGWVVMIVLLLRAFWREQTSPGEALGSIFISTAVGFAMVVAVYVARHV